MPESPPAESRLLLSCARSDFGEEARASVEALLHRGIDWPSLLASARRQNLLPILYERLRDLDAARVPPDVLAGLKGAYYTNLLRNQRLGADLVEIVTALRQEGIHVIVLKGGALARTVYQSPAQRPMADLDLLVQQEQMARAGTVLEALGYSLSGAIPARMAAFQQRFGGGLEWLRSREGQITRLDLQFDLVGVDWCWDAFPVEPDALWEAARPLDLDGTPALQLSPEDTLIHLCLHPALHHGYYCPIISYVDMDRLIAVSGPDFSWARLVERTERFQVKTVVYHGLQCAHRLLGTPLPGDVQRALKPGAVQLRVLRALAPLSPEALFDADRHSPRGVRQVMLYIALVDRARDAGSIVRGILFPGEEWLAVRYSLESGEQARRYRLVHPLRVARAFLRGLTRPLIESSLE